MAFHRSHAGNTLRPMQQGPVRRTQQTPPGTHPRRNPTEPLTLARRCPPNPAPGMLARARKRVSVWPGCQVLVIGRRGIARLRGVRPRLRGRPASLWRGSGSPGRPPAVTGARRPPPTRAVPSPSPVWAQGGRSHRDASGGPAAARRNAACGGTSFQSSAPAAGAEDGIGMIPPCGRAAGPDAGLARPLRSLKSCIRSC